MNLDQILEQYAEWRVVVDTYDKLIQEIASTKVSLEKFLPTGTISIVENHLERQQKTLQNLLSYVQEELKTEIPALHTKVRDMRAILDIYDNALNELSTIQQAYELLERSGHFDTEGAEFSKDEYIEEIRRLQKNTEDTYEYLIEVAGVKEHIS